MNPHRWRTRKWLAVVLLGGLAAGLAPVPASRAADLDKLDSSLKWIPADAAFYTSMLRTGEQVQALAKSKAWAKIKALPGMQLALQQLDAQLKQPGNPQLAMALQLYKQPENQQLVALLGDMVSHEVFTYGGDSTLGFLEFLARVNGAQRFGAVFAAAAGQAKPPNAGKLQVRMILQGLADNLDLIKFPDLIIGFKISKTEPAEAQLKRLEDLLNGLAEQAPPLKGRVKREKVAGGDFLTVTVDGSLVPWEKVSLKEFEDKEGQFDKLLEKLKQLKLTVSLGIRDSYVLLALGESTAGIAKLGGGNGLAGRPELKPVERHADQRLTSITYVSQALRVAVGTSRKDIDALAKEAAELLKKAELPPQLNDRLAKDLTDLATDVKSYIHDKGAMVSFAYLTERGQESFDYDWSEFPGVDGSKPLSLLHHVGGAPLLAVVGRTRYAPENYQLLVKWVKVANSYFEDLALPRFNEAQKAQYEQVAKVLHPFVHKFDKITGTLLLPSLKDGQTAFVLDGKLRSKHWQQQLPTTDKALPILEPALVIGISDAAQLRKAFGEYRTVVNELIAKLHELNPQIQDFQIPDPETQKAGAGMLYFYPIPEELGLGLDKQLLPNAGLSDHVAVLSLSKSHSERLLGNHPLKADGGPLADLSRPLVGVVYFNWAELLNTATPWIQFGLQAAVQAQAAGGGGGGPQWKDILGQVDTVLEVLKCFRTYSSATYFEDKALVTHGETVVRDLQE